MKTHDFHALNEEKESCIDRPRTQLIKTKFTKPKTSETNSLKRTPFPYIHSASQLKPNPNKPNRTSTETESKPLVHTYSFPKAFVAQKRVKVLSDSEKVFAEKYSQDNILSCIQAKMSAVPSQEQRLGFKGAKAVSVQAKKVRSKSTLNNSKSSHNMRWSKEASRNYIVTGRRTRVFRAVQKRNNNHSAAKTAIVKTSVVVPTETDTKTYDEYFNYARESVMRNSEDTNNHHSDREMNNHNVENSKTRFKGMKEPEDIGSHKDDLIDASNVSL
eukprot:TRINITY_DN3006_c0_g2_i1.p1 TRINITY_DN3006_c0_g2~~TRINITY_DN3006_c0_g2_i1.p1  ORF type:complete len:273 (+),score=34.81 TRINITY_DN3006_c0_g2_i1:923-1741(+)